MTFEYLTNCVFILFLFSDFSDVFTDDVDGSAAHFVDRFSLCFYTAAAELLLSTVTQTDMYVCPAAMYMRVQSGPGVNSRAVSVMCIPVCVCVCVCVNNSLLAVIADEGCVSGERALNAPRQPVRRTE